MTVIEAYKIVFELLSSSEINNESGAYTVVSLATDFSASQEEEVNSALSLMKYMKDTSENFVTVANNKLLYISRSSDAWSGYCPLFTTKDKLWNKIIQQEPVSNFSFPEHFFIQDNKLSSFDDTCEKLIKKIKCVLVWRELLSSLSDHVIDNNNFVFFINKDDVGKKYHLNTSLNFDSVESISFPDESINAAKYLSGKIADEDAHHDERRSVMRSTLSDFFDNSEEECFLNVVSKAERFKLKYNELYSLYIDRFSINKILNELETKSLEYTGKVNELLASGQVRALTIPGAIVAVGALYRTESFMNSLLILLAVFLVKELTITANQVHRETFLFLEEQVESSFDKYLKTGEDQGVKVSAGENKSKLITLIGNAKGRLDKIDDWAKWTFWGAVAYILLGCF